MKKIIRTSTIPLSLDILLKGQLAFLKQYYEIIAVSGEDNSLRNIENREKVRVFPIEMHRQIAPFKDIISLCKLYRFLKKEKPLIIHSITPKAGLLCMVAAYFANVPLRIHTFTGLVFPSKTGVMQRLLILMDKVLCHCATHIYPEGQGVKNDLIKYKITNKNLKVVANGNVNGIDVDYFNPRLFSNFEKQKTRIKLDISQESFVFVFVGRLIGDKGINELIAAFLNLKSETLNFKLLLVGPLETELDPLLPKTLNAIESNPNIISVGFQKDVRPYLAISNCLAFPSYREGFPNVVMQAGAMGLPSIVTNINGCNEIIIEGQNGIIIPVKDIDALYNAMKKMVADEYEARRLQQNARPMIVSRYEQKVVWEAILAEYKRLEQNV
jgi:glycosyltransferase involved in cell wall biosynthesis